MSSSRALIEALAAEGTEEGRGQFTLDRAKARDKLQRFQLADPTRYVLLVIEAAVAQGATRIDVTIDADDTRFRFDGRGFPARELEQLWDVLLGDRGDAAPGLRPLALALNAATGLSPKFIRLESGRDGEGTKLEIRGDTAPSATPLSSFSGGTTVHVRERMGLGTLGQLFLSLAGRRDEAQLIRENCAAVDIPLFIGRQRVSTGRPTGTGLHGRHVEVDGAWIAFGVTEDPQQRGGLELCRHGVRVSFGEFEDLPPGVHVLVDDGRLAVDLSHAGIRRDARSDFVFSQLHAHFWPWLAETLRSELVDTSRLATSQTDASQTDAPSEQVAAVERLARWRRFRDLYCGALHRAAETLRKLESAAGENGTPTPPDDPRGSTPSHPCESLYDIPYYWSLGGRQLSIRELQTLAQKRGWVGACAKRPVHGVPSSETDTILVGDPVDREALMNAMRGEIRNRDAILARADVRAMNKKRWERNRREPRLGLGPWLARAPFVAELGEENDAIRGELGFRSIEHEARIELIYEGGLIYSFHPGMPFPGFVAVVEGPFEPLRTFDGVRRDRNFSRVLVAVLEAFLDLLLDFERGRFSGSVRGGSGTWRRGLLARLDEDFGRELFEAAGLSDKNVDRAQRWVRRGVLDPGSEHAHPCVDHPFIPTLRGDAMSLRELGAHLEAEGELEVVLTSAGLPTAALADPEAPRIFILDPELTSIVEKVFPDVEMVSGVETLQRLEAKARFFARAPWELDPELVPPSLDGLLVPRWFEAGPEGLRHRAWMGLDGAFLREYWKREGGPAQLDLRVAGRPVARIEYPAPFPGLEAVVDFELDALDENFTELREEALHLLSELVADYMSTLWQAPELAQLDPRRPAAQGVLRALFLQATPARVQLDAGPWAELARLIEVPLLDGTRASLAELIDAARAKKAFETARGVELMTVLEEGRLCLDGESPALPFVRGLGWWPVNDIGDELRERKLHEELSARPAMERLELPELAKFKAEFEFELGGRKFHGQVGVPFADPQQGSAALNCVVARRLVERVTPSIPLALVAAVEGPFELESPRRVERDALFFAVTDQIEKAAAKLLDALVDDLGDPSATSFGYAERWMWALLERGIGVHASPEFERALERLPLLERADGARLSIEDARASSGGRPPPWLDETAVRKLAAPAGALVTPMPRMKRLAELVDFRHTDQTANWIRRERALSGTRSIVERCPRPWPPATALIHVEQQTARATIHLWLAPEDDSLLHHVIDGKVLRDEQPWHPLAIAGVVVHDDPPLYDLSVTQHGDLELEVLMQGHRLIENAIEALRADTASDALRERLCRVYERARPSRDVDLTRFAEALAELPLYPSRGGWQTPRERERRLEVEAVEEAKAARLRTLMEAERTAREQDALNIDEDEELDAIFGTLLVESLAEKNATPSPSEALLARIREALEAAKEVHGDSAGKAFRSALISGVKLSERARFRKTTVRIEEGGPRLAPACPLVLEALVTTPSDPCLTHLLASNVAAGIDVWLDEVEPRHQLALVAGLLRMTLEATESAGEG